MPVSTTLYSLQLLRFIAAMLVLLFHLRLDPSGYKGVDVFFVISGFVMYYTAYLSKKPKAYVFIINRLTKIFLLYWVALIFLYFVLPFDLNGSFLKTLFLVPGHHSVLGVSWSLSYELYFYFLFALIVYALPSKWHLLIFWTVLMIATGAAIYQSRSNAVEGTLFNFILSANLWEFLLGVLGAYLFSRLRNKINTITVLIIAIISGVLLIAIRIDYLNPMYHLVYGFISFVLIFSITTYESNAGFNSKLKWLVKYPGDASYAIYLFGPVVTYMIGDKNIESKILIVVTIALSIVANKLLEENLLRWTRKRLYNLVSVSSAEKQKVFDHPRK
jgi:peptidoglycan/LPS O-acetylase OafA/YrhL